MNFAKNLKSSKFTWRQIDVSAKEIIVKGNSEINLVGGFMHSECKILFDFAIIKNHR